MKRIIVFYSPSCAFSAATISFLVLRGADFDVVNLEEHPDERRRLETELDGKKLETPLLAAADGLHVAPPLSELRDMLEQWKLSPRAAPHEKIRRAEAES